MNTHPKMILFMLGLWLSFDTFSPNSSAKDVQFNFWPPDVVSWRTHQGPGTYESSSASPIRRGLACYRTVFFGDSICAGYDNQYPLSTMRSFCENMAIRLSAENGDIITKYENFSKTGATATEILNEMKKHQNSLQKAHLLTWEAGGNDILFARQAFRNIAEKKSYCRQCLLDNELGNAGATGPDPRCKDIIGVLQKYKPILKEMITFVKKHASPSAMIRVMGLYYPLMTEDKLPDLNCTDPDTQQHYVNTYSVFLPIIAKGIFTTLDSISHQRADGDLRFSAFESLPQFNTAPQFKDIAINYIPGESMEHYVNESILAHQDLLADPYFQTIPLENGSVSKIMQTSFGTKDRSDIHPSEAGHILIQQINSTVPYEFPIPSITTSQLDCP